MPWAVHLHKSQLASDRTNCRLALANQVRLVLHTAAYWLMLTVRDAIARTHPLASAEFTTLRMRLLKIAGRITRLPHVSASPLPQPAQKRRCSVASPSASSPPDRDATGALSPTEVGHHQTGNY